MSHRSRRRPRVLLTGIAGNLGLAVARRLHRTFDLVGVDRRPTPPLPKDIAVEVVDIRRRRAEDLFRRFDFDAVVHLNILHDPRSSQQQHHDFNINGTKKLADLCATHRVPKFILLSSANAYGPSGSNDQFLTEDAPLLGGQNFGAIRDLVAVDMLCNSFFWRHPEVETVILRPAHIIGRVDNAPTRYLRMPRPITLLGFDPMIQLVHVEDVVSALALALTPGIRGVYNIAGPPPTPLSYLHSSLGRSPVPIPEPLAHAYLRAAWSIKVSDWPAPELDHIKYICMVDDSAARQTLRYHHAHALDSIIDALDAPS